MNALWAVFLWKQCSGAPVSGCSSLEEEVGGKNERFSALTHKYSWHLNDLPLIANSTVRHSDVSQSEASDPLVRYQP